MSEENNIGENTPKDTVNGQNKTQVPPPTATQVDAGATAPKKVRRVGTFTMGVALIIVGIAMCAALIVPDQDLLLVAKFAPLVLVALGIEILISSFFYRNDKIKYDGLSIFLCIILIFGAVCASMLPIVFSYLGPAKYAAENNISNGIEEAMFNQKDDLPEINDIRVNVNMIPFKEFTGKETIDDITMADTIYAFVNFGGSYKDKNSFATDAIKVLSAMEKTTKNKSLQLNIVSQSEANGPYYELDFQGRFSKSHDAKSLEKIVIEYAYDEKLGGYVSDDERAQVQRTYDEAYEQAEQLRSNASTEAEEVRSAAQKDAEELRSAAEKDAEEVRSAAQRDAEELRNAAEEDAQQVRNNASQATSAS